jgi:hypothetical protein
MNVRLIGLIGAVFVLAGCATASPNPTQSAEISDGPTSELAPGQCGLFGWSTDDTRSFIFYADEKTARYANADGPTDLIAQSAFPATEYRDRAGETVSLRLGEGEAMVGGMRYPGARIATLTDEGWERLQPVAIIKTCKPAE